MKRKKDTRGDLIVGRARINGIDVKRMASKAGLCLSTVYKRIQLPGTMTIDELTSIDKVVHFDDAEIIRLIRNT
jgi:hypothetical protein